MDGTGTDRAWVGKSPQKPRGVVGWLAVVGINVWMPIGMVVETGVALAIAPVLWMVWRLSTDWSLGKIMRHFIWMYGRVWLWIVAPFVRVTSVGMEPERVAPPKVFVVNHLSFFDMYIVSLLPVSDVVIFLRSWPFKMAWYAPFMRGAEYLDVERLPWERVVAKTRKFFEEGHSVLLFPQGHRSRDGKLGRFHSGAFKLALQFGVPIVPLCITGTDRLLPPGRRWLAPARVRLECLEPVHPTDFRGETAHIELRKHIKQIMGACLACATS